MSGRVPPGLAGHVALVTGAGRGIGAATAHALAARGAKVSLVARTVAELERVADEIRVRHGEGRTIAIAADVADEGAVRAAFDATKEAFGPVRILVANAGILLRAPFAEMTSDEWDRVMGVNLRGAFLCAREAFVHMRAGGAGGAIVAVGSLGGLPGTQKFSGYSAYTTSKYALAGLCECLAVEGRAFGIRANCVAPGAVDTAMLRDADPSLRTRTSPAQIAEIIAFLCDETRSAAICGTVIEVNSNET